ncbi:MAG TPA: glucosaminidase domain-containing protein [bacterium]|nr:glucosaminidase domain-containing protein [bacterium]HOL35087.1 glucosaminidase domain-containing protein [bacterium]HPP07868.1 glucosaminidase domain-containing protein [bacterium]
MLKWKCVLILILIFFVTPETIIYSQVNPIIFKNSDFEIKIEIFIDIIHIYWKTRSENSTFELKILEDNEECFVLIPEYKEGLKYYVISGGTKKIQIILNQVLPEQESYLLAEELHTFNKGISLDYISEYIEKVLTWAKNENLEYGIPISVSIAQSALETGWGQSNLCTSYNNYFGLMYPWGKNSPYPKNGMTASGYNIYFEASDSFLDHGWGLKNYSRYQFCRDYKNDPDRFIKEIRKAGYSTDEMYAANVIKIMQKYDLYQYDEPITFSTNFKPKNLIVTADFLDKETNQQEK